MEPRFSSSFIPKKPISPVALPKQSKTPLGLPFFIASIVLLGTLILAGGVFGYQEYLKTEMARKSEALEEARRDLEPALIEELRRLEARMNHVSDVLRNHLALTPIFELLQESTAQNVEYSSFDYTFGQEGVVELTLAGRAASFKSLAFQSDVLNRQTMYRASTYSGLSVDEFGRVNFSLIVDVDPSLISYANLIAAMAVPTLDLSNEGGTTTPLQVPNATTPAAPSAGGAVAPLQIPVTQPPL
jgi:hypothetical protein